MESPYGVPNCIKLQVSDILCAPISDIPSSKNLEQSDKETYPFQVCYPLDNEPEWFGCSYFGLVNNLIQRKNVTDVMAVYIVEKINAGETVRIGDHQWRKRTFRE